ncbi:hypothetical protein [Chromobacterium aquaticum]|uniref:Uncharacterized protein n=1 Tax=Chromobacterium aquaticum TaxID=467180 RepID=A0ABV8ZWH3_9NEIS|nr:hypothetical protein [Chromobacterium aquaticum]MCD5360797.1 hypothetical protein [Chromobacterium aquaticum]
MGSCDTHGAFNGNTCPQCTNHIQILKIIKIPDYMEPVIGATLLASNLPAAMRVRLLSTVAPQNVHSQILSQGLMPQSMLKKTEGLTPPIDKFAKDSKNRIYLGGGTSTTVYSNIRGLSEVNPDWIKTTKNSRFQCAFLFRPTLGILKYPLIVIVPEDLFLKNFMKDEFSVVKIFKERFMGFSNTVPIPGAVKSVEHFTLVPKYFLASTHFSPQSIIHEAWQGQILNPARFMRGVSFSGIGSALIFNWVRNKHSTQEKH